MSDRTPGGKLPLPSPRSPQELDRRILSYARDNAPERGPRSFPLGWASGFAAACVATVAVIVSVPEPAVDQATPAATALEGKRERSVKEPAAARKAIQARADMSLPQAAPAEAETVADAEERRDSAFYRMGINAPEQAPLPPDLTSELQALQALLQQGQAEAAQLRWGEYRASHPHADLPESLGEAIGVHLTE